MPEYYTELTYKVKLAGIPADVKANADKIHAEVCKVVESVIQPSAGDEFKFGMADKKVFDSKKEA